MNILIVGSGGREHALAWKTAQSPRCKRLLIAPGNGGTAALGENIPVQVENVDGLVALAKENAVDLVIIGPEAALAVGLVDALQAAGVRAFGPSRLAARIETSKAFAKDFMARWEIPTARYASFDDYNAALAHLDAVSYPVVIKTSGLAAGKGVMLPESRQAAREALRAMMVERIFGSAGETVIIEERLEGEEVSLLAFTDGLTVRAMPPAQDHKRLLQDDQGPNTGGMGAYAPAPVCPPALAEAVVRTVLQPAVDGLRAEGCPFVGVLYAGIILTADGPRVLEFNCRFGDPETQALLPLLESDLLEIIDACAEHRLAEVQPRWKDGAAASIVLASGGYPGAYEKGKPIQGLDSAADEQSVIFHAGTDLRAGQVVSAGGRVLNVTGFGADLRAALNAAYRAVDCVCFEGMQYRPDIGQKAFRHIIPVTPAAPSAYAAAGVDIDAGNRAVMLMRDAVRSTYTPQVLAGIGAFGGLYDGAALQGMRGPVLVASTDGVGTKVRVAAAAKRCGSIGADIVNHCVNDILVQGARPLFFLDYFASAKLEPETVAEIVSGIAGACRAAGCALLGGETAEMPGVYGPGEFDLAGTIVGVVEQEKILPRKDIHAGDLLVGLASDGPHTNGYSLIRRAFADVPLDTVFPELGASVTLADVLLKPHRSYLPVLWKALECSPSPVKALAHLTGGAFIENIPRVLPEGLRAVIRRGTWEIPALYRLIQERAGIAEEEMYRVFNLGIGIVAVVAPEDLDAFRSYVDEPVWVIGSIEHGPKGTELR